MDIFTEDTVFLELNKKVLFTDEINIDYNTFNRYPNWYQKNGNFYYGKLLDSKGILIHLLCSYIANEVFNLKASKFFLAKIGNKTGLASLNFREKDSVYFYANSTYFPSFLAPHQLLVYLKKCIPLDNEEIYQNLVNDLLNLISFHIYVGLRDIIPCNVLLKKEIEGFSLANVYDFDYAFENGKLNKYNYRSCICSFSLPSKELDTLIEYFPKFKTNLLKMMDIDMSSYLEKLATEKNLYINDLYKDYFFKQDEIKKEFVRSLHL